MLTCSWWAFLPPLYSVATIAGLWVAYFVAVKDGKIAPLTGPHGGANGTFYAPYISIIGSFPPASCIVSEVMNLTGFMAFIIAVLRYLQLKGRIGKAWLNSSCLAAFSISCLGATVVGNVQMFVDIEIHMVANAISFGLGILYCWVQSGITLVVNFKNEGRKVGVVRLLLSGCITFCMVLQTFMMLQKHHMHSARSAWALAICLFMFIGTFGIEFRYSNFAIVCTDISRSSIEAPHAFSEVSTEPQQRSKMLTCSWWAFLPPLYSLATAVGLWVAYFVAVKDGKIAPLTAPHRIVNGTLLYAPYISIVGNFPPARCIFSEVMNLAAFMGFIMAILRYLQLKGRMDRAWLNSGCLAAFSISSLGMTVVGNVQLFVDIEIHMTAVMIMFGLGILYCWVQSGITLVVNFKNEGRKVGVVRLLLSGGITLCTVLYVSMMLQKHHLQSARSLWVLVMFFLMFLGTFGVEFRHSNFAIVCTDDFRSSIELPHTFSEVSTEPQQE